MTHSKSDSSNDNSKHKARLIIMNFIRAMLVLAFFGALSNKRWLVLFVSLTALLVTFLPTFLERHFKIKIPAEFEIMILLFIYGSLFFGEVRGFYAMFWWWDLLLNLAASIALGLVGLTIMYVLYKDEKIDASPFIIVLFAFTFSVAAGTLWEIFEFAADTLFKFNLQGSGLQDTMSDIIVNSIGAFLVSAIGYSYIKHGRFNIISTFLERFIESNPHFFRSGKNTDHSAKIKSLIGEGESSKLEFKETLRLNRHTNQPDKKIEHSVLKTIAGFLNSSGGILLIGVRDDGSIRGIEHDNFQSSDKAALHLTNLIKDSIGSEFLPFISSEFIRLESKTIIKVTCSKTNKPVFLKRDGIEEYFVRNGPSTNRLEGSALVEYIYNRFKSYSNT